MKGKKTLANAPQNATVVVENVEGSELRSQLLELGITKGRVVRVLYEAPLGDPIAVDISGFVLSLRKAEAELIEVRF